MKCTRFDWFSCLFIKKNLTVFSIIKNLFQWESIASIEIQNVFPSVYLVPILFSSFAFFFRFSHNVQSWTWVLLKKRLENRRERNVINWISILPANFSRTLTPIFFSSFHIPKRFSRPDGATDANDVLYKITSICLVKLKM